MPHVHYDFQLDYETRVVVYFWTERGDVRRFVVKLEVARNGDWKEVLRYDCYHDSVHKDVLASDGSKARVVRYELLDPASGLNAAIRDCQENHVRYTERWRHDS